MHDTQKLSETQSKYKANTHVLVGRRVPRLCGAMKCCLLFSVGSQCQATAKYSPGKTLPISFHTSLCLLMFDVSVSLSKKKSSVADKLRCKG